MEAVGKYSQEHLMDENQSAFTEYFEQQNDMLTAGLMSEEKLE